MKKIFTFLFAALIFNNASSQSVPVGHYAEQFLRIYQVTGLSSDPSSFTQRPLNSTIYVKEDSVLQQFVASKNLLKTKNFLGSPAVLKILPFNFLLDYN